MWLKRKRFEGTHRALSTIYWIILRYPVDNIVRETTYLVSTLEVCPKDH